MTFSVAQAAPYKYNDETGNFDKINRKVEARKTFNGNVKQSINEWGVCSLDNPAGQPFWKHEHLCEEFAQDLCSLDYHKEPLVIFRGNEIKQVKAGLSKKLNLTRTAGDWIQDSRSCFCMFDVDHFSDSPDLNVSTGLKERLQIYIQERAPFLKGKRVIVMASSSMGVEFIVKDGSKIDQSKRMNIRVFVEFNQPFTMKEFREELGEYLFKGEDEQGNPVPAVLDDANITRHAQKTYIQSANLIDTVNHFNGVKALFVDGEPLTFNEIKEKGAKRNIKQSKLVAQETLEYVSEINMSKVADIVVRKAEDSESKWDYFSKLIGQMYFTIPEKVAPLIKEIEENQRQIYGSSFTPSKLRGIKNHFEKETLNRLLCHNAELRRYFKKQLKINSIDLSKEIDIIGQGVMSPQQFAEEHIINQRYLCFASDCGTAKTKGVIKYLVEHCKQTGKSLLYIANTTAIVVKQAEEFNINDYHKNGTEPQQKQSVIQASAQLSICYRSLHYYKNLELSDWCYDYLIVDEASQVLRGWESNIQETNEEMKWLFGLANKARHVHLYDADIDDELCSWFLTELAQFKAEEAAFYVNNAKRAEGYQIQLAKTPDIAIKELLDRIDAGNRVCVFINDSDENGRMSAFVDYIKTNTKTDINSLFFDGQSEKTELIKNTRNYLSNKLKDGLNLLVLNSWAGIGFDYFDPEEHFDECFVIDLKGWLTSKTLWQFLRRMRTVRKGLVYSRFSNTLALPYRRQKLLIEHKGINPELFDSLDSHYMRAIHCHEMDRAKARYSFMAQVELRGGVITELNDSKNEKYQGYSSSLIKHTELYREAKGFIDTKKTENIKKVIDRFYAYDGDWRELTDSEVEENHSKLSREYDLMTASKARRLIEVLGMTEEERKFQDRNSVNEISEILGGVLEAFVRLAFRGCESTLQGFLEWFLYSEEEYIQMAGELLDESEARDFLVYLQEYKFLLPDDLKIPKDSYKTPTKAIKALSGFFGLEYKATEKGKKQEAQKKLFAYYEKNKLKGFPMGRNSVNKRKAFAKEYLKGKSKHLPLEEKYIQALQTPYRLYRKEYIPKELYNNFEALLDNIKDIKVLSFEEERAKRKKEYLRNKQQKGFDRKTPRERPEKQICGVER